MIVEISSFFQHFKVLPTFDDRYEMNDCGDGEWWNVLAMIVNHNIILCFKLLACTLTDNYFAHFRYWVMIHSQLFENIFHHIGSICWLFEFKIVVRLLHLHGLQEDAGNHWHAHHAHRGHIFVTSFDSEADSLGDELRAIGESLLPAKLLYNYIDMIIDI